MFGFSRDDVKYKLLKRMKSSLINVGYCMFKHYLSNEFAPMHYQISDMFINVIKSGKNLLLIMPRGFAKSTFGLLFFPIWCLFFSNKCYIILIGESSTAIHRHFESKLAYELKNNKVLKALGIKPTSHWHVSKDNCSIEVIAPSIFHGKRRVRIEGYSYGVSLRGASIGEKRPDLILIDDLERQKTKTAAGVESEQYRADVRGWFYSEIVPIGGAAGDLQIVFMGTIMHIDQLLHRVYLNPFTGTSMEFLTVKMGYLIPDPTHVTGFKSLWPDRQPVEDLLAKKDAYYADGEGNRFANEWLSEVQDSRNQIFSDGMNRYYYREGKTLVVYKSGSKHDLADGEYIREFERRIRLDDLKLYAVVDPAVGEDENHCDSAIAIIGISHKREWFLVDMRFGKWRGSRLWDEIFKVNTDYDIVSTGIEAVGYQKTIPDSLKQMMRTRRTYFRVKEIKNKNQNKHVRIISHLEWRYKMGKVFHDINAPYLNKLEGQLKNVSIDGAKGLIDLVDALALGGDHIKGTGNAPAKNLPKEKTIEYYEYIHSLNQPQRAGIV